MSTNCDKFNGNTIPTIFTDKMNEDAQSDPVEMELELRNLQSVINVTRENIDALNAKFANLQEPPPMYIKEYQELASKLHELRDKELEIMEKLQQQCEYATNTVTVEPPEPPDPDTEVSVWEINLAVGVLWGAAGGIQFPLSPRGGRRRKVRCL